MYRYPHDGKRTCPLGKRRMFVCEYKTIWAESIKIPAVKLGFVKRNAGAFDSETGTISAYAFEL